MPQARTAADPGLFLSPLDVDVIPRFLFSSLTPAELQHPLLSNSSISEISNLIMILFNTPNFLTLITLLPLILAKTFPPCIESCISAHPSHSWCSGHETGRRQEECLCRGLDGHPLIHCVRGCDPADQWDFAGGLSGTCRERLFPEARNGLNESQRNGARRLNGGFGVGRFLGLGVVVVVVTGS